MACGKQCLSINRMLSLLNSQISTCSHMFFLFSHHVKPRPTARNYPGWQRNYYGRYTKAFSTSKMIKSVETCIIIDISTQWTLLDKSSRLRSARCRYHLCASPLAWNSQWNHPCNWRADRDHSWCKCPTVWTWWWRGRNPQRRRAQLENIQECGVHHSRENRSYGERAPLPLQI